MFGFRGAESVATVERKRGYILDAQKHWPFLTNFDATTIKNERQLVTMVTERDRWDSEAEEQVYQWMENKVL